ncbi:MAG: hypothetical protein U1A77_10560 [Pirellulales bacterium]
MTAKSMILAAIATWAFVLLCADRPSAAADVQRIDLNQDNGRGDVISRGWENWRVTEGESSSFRVGDITWELRASDSQHPIKTSWWKPGFDYPATMASDGVVCQGPIRLIIHGLPTGRHSLGVWHNALTDSAPTPFHIIAPTGSTTTVTPSHRVRHDDDSAAAYLTFDAISGKDVEILFRSAEQGELVLNGFELNHPHPLRRASHPAPANDDEHVAEHPTLRWQPGSNALKHRVFVGRSAAAVAAATVDSPEFRGEFTTPEYDAKPLALDHQQAWYWRVDEVGEQGVERGQVWRFQVRRLAFPGAQGYGRFARGGRAGRVIEVTNLDDAGPGSLREAVESTGPRTVVFRVGGLIELRSKLVVANPYLTVAGETAPGDGICLKNYTVGCSDTHDIIMRHLRIRVGDESKTTQDGSGARGCDHVIFDHCSISWSIDEGFSSRQARNLTVQYCLIAEALHLADHKKYAPGKGHSFAASISGDIGSFHHNLLAHCTGRNWSLAGGLDRTANRLAGRLDIRNNIVFNWRDRTTDGGVLGLCFVGNLYLPGPATRVFSLLKPDTGDAARGMQAYMTGNRVEGKAGIEQDNWTAFVGNPEDLAQVRVDQPLWESHVTMQSTDELLELLLPNVGATRPRRDAVDRRIIEDVVARKATFKGSRGGLPGILDSQADAGGWPAYSSAEPPLDSDHDGLPDAWETEKQLNPQDPHDGASYASDGYTHLEHYLHHLTRQSAPR